MKMKKLSKRIWALVLSLTMVLGMLPVGAMAATSVGDAVDSITSGASYVIGDGNGNYAVVSGNSLTVTTNADEATVWTADSASRLSNASNSYLYINGTAQADSAGANSSWTIDNGYLVCDGYYLLISGTTWTGTITSGSAAGMLYAVSEDTSSNMATSVATSSSSTPYRIVMLDCGRKYFSVDNIKTLINTMAKYGYNQLQLSFGNGGCRFLLDDMSLSFGDVTMTSDTVKSNITAGNSDFNDDTRYLTETNMTDIITYATSKGIDIVPMLNMPGHASAIVYNTSYSDNGNLDVSNATAREYGYALLSKYVDYFDKQGCSYFHFGADESGYTGTNMSTFLQGCVDVITAAGMTPRMFNDPADSSGSTTIPEGVQITYWYINSHKSASTLANAGYDLINTHGRWYYVIKTAQNSEVGTKYWQGTVNTSAVSVELPVMKAEEMDNYWVGINEFFDANPGYGSTISDNLGTMFCIWCDASQDAYLTDSDVISENEDYGALYQLQKMAEHYWPDDINTDTGDGDGSTDTDTTTVTITTTSGETAPSALVTGGSTLLTVGESATWTSSDESVISLASADETSVAALSTEITATNVTATAVGAGTATITATTTSGTDTLNVTVTDEQTTETTEQTVNIKVGDEVTFDTTGTAGDYIVGDNQYIATANVTVVPGTTETTVSTSKATELEDGATYIIRVFDTTYALSTTTGSRDWGTSTLLFETNTLTANENHLWTLEKVDNGYKIKNAAGYLHLGGAVNNTAYVDETGEVFTLTYTDIGWTIGNQSGEYINQLGGSTSAGGWTGDGTRFDLYKVTTATEGSSTLTITGTGEGQTTATVGSVTYTINVTAPSTTENKVLNYSGTLTLPTGAADVTVTGTAVSYADGTITAGNTDGTATVTFVTKNDGGKVTARYTYNITVAEVDLSEVDPLEVELWVTNTPIGKDANSNDDDVHWSGLNIYLEGTTTVCTPATMTISAADAYGEDGVLLSDYVLAEGVSYNNNGTYKDGYTYIFWKGVALHNGTKQYHSNAAQDLDKSDQSGNGSNFLKIRYWKDAWQYYDYDANAWVTKKDDDNFVAYYLQEFVVSPELTTATRDWGGIAGQGGGTWGENQTWFDGFYGVGTAVVYPDYSMSPAGDQAIYDSSLALFCATKGISAQPGVITISEPTDYQITKITIVQGVHADAAGNKSSEKLWQIDDTVTWDKVTTEAGTEWYDETTIWTPEGYTGGTIFLDSTVWNAYAEACTLAEAMNHAFLILIYIEPVAKEDNLNVIWWDDDADMEIMSSQIVVNEGTTYTNALKDNGIVIGNKSSWSSNDPNSADYLPDTAYVTNTAGVNRTFNKDITVVSTIADQYRTGIYKYISAEISADGKTLTLHYDIDPEELAPLYVIDFGLPAQFELSDVIENEQQVTAIEYGNGTYGSLAMDIPNGITSATFTYTPHSVLKNTDAVKLTFTLSNNETISKRIGFMPASNVLYEDSFFSENTTTGTAYKSWTHTAGTTPTQSTDQTTLYGYDTAYVTDVTSGTNSLDSAWTVSDMTATGTTAGSRYLTTTFTGNGFDLIGTAGPDTGIVYLMLNGPENRLIIVDTCYMDDNGTTLYQVPLAHEMLTEGTYTVNIRSRYRAESGTQSSGSNTRSTYSAFGGSAALNDIYAAIDELFMDGMDFDDVKFVYFDESSPLAELENSTYAMTYSNSTDSTSTASSTYRPAGTSVTIDGFRVYRSTENTTYLESEQYLTYQNVLDATLDGTTNATGEVVFTAYVENTDGQGWTLSSYEKNGGPQNEVYLGANNSDAIAFKVGTAATTVQISARAVGTGSAKLVVNGNVVETIECNTEMYYEVTSNDTGIIAITNTGEGMLALGNLKYNVTSGASLMMLGEEDYPVVYSLLSRSVTSGEDADDGTEDTETPEQPETPSVPSAPVKPGVPSIIWPTYTPSQKDVFRPDVFEMDVESYTLLGKRFVSIIVDASTDVSKLTINGAPVWASNYLWVKSGQDDNYRFTMLLVLDAGEKANFQVVAYDKKGVASKTYTITD